VRPGQLASQILLGLLGFQPYLGEAQARRRVALGYWLGTVPVITSPGWPGSSGAGSDPSKASWPDQSGTSGRRQPHGFGWRGLFDYAISPRPGWPCLAHSPWRALMQPRQGVGRAVWRPWPWPDSLVAALALTFAQMPGGPGLVCDRGRSSNWLWLLALFVATADSCGLASLPVLPAKPSSNRPRSLVPVALGRLSDLTLRKRAPPGDSPG